MGNLGLDRDLEKDQNLVLGTGFHELDKEDGLTLPGYCLNPWKVDLFKIDGLCLGLPCLLLAVLLLI